MRARIFHVVASLSATVLAVAIALRDQVGR